MNETLASSDIRDEDTLHGRYLTFQVGKETFGIPISYVIEIVGLQTITELPEMPDYIKGVINLRGNVIPVMDVRIRFGLSQRNYDDRTCIIVVDLNGGRIGLIIDSVSDVLTIDDDEIIQTPEMSAREGSSYISRIGRTADQIILLIDCGRLLGGDQVYVYSSIDA
ncbi:MAG: chemotaxis protein CheW [Oscillospiraceae bacterium]|nr:chemotaxis protein CheW [Oscillospiraceae bacterium]